MAFLNGGRIRFSFLIEMRISYFISALLALATSSASLANVTLPSVLSDGMVIEQNSTVKIWGWAKPYE